MENKEIKVGSIFIANDYYNDITTWYRVIELRGTMSVKVERLNIIHTSGGGYIHSGTCMPNLDEPGTPLTKLYRVKNNRIKISNYVTATLWNGEAGTYDYDHD